MKAWIRRIRETEKEDEMLFFTYLEGELLFLFQNPIFSFSNEDFSKRVEKERSLETTQDFTILSENNVVVGYSVLKIDYESLNALLRTTVNKEEYGLSALLAVINYAFFELDLYRVYGYIKESSSFLKPIERLGFKVEGVLRESVYKEGRFQNVLVLGLLKDEYIINTKT